MDEGLVPNSWKLANVTPVFKKGNRALVSNYRPIRFTSIPCKIFESIIKENILEQLENHDLLKTTQHGFLSQKSCTTNLLEYLDFVTSAIDGGHNVFI